MLPNQVIGLFEASLEQPDWMDDKVPDQFPRSWGKNGSGMPPPGSGSGANNGDPNRGKKTWAQQELSDRFGATLGQATKDGSTRQLNTQPGLVNLDAIDTAHCNKRAYQNLVSR